MNIVYTAFDEKFLELAKIMIASLLENTSCDIIHAGLVSTGGVTADHENISELYELGNNVIPFLIAKTKWEKNRMAYKIELIETFQMEESNRIFVLDTDLYVKKDIFKWFDDTSDILLTTRPEFFLSVNGGVWGFKWNSNGKKFIKFFIEQMQHPTWCEFKKYRIKNAHDQEGRDWWMDQDFLCTVHDHGLPFSCSVKKLHCRTHNCTPSKRGLETCMNNPDKHIVHFKGGLKQCWLDYYPKYMRRKSVKTD